MTHWQVTEQSLSDIRNKKKLPENALHTFVFEIFIRNRFSVCEDSLGSSVYEFMVGKCFGVFYTSVHILNTEQNIKMY